MKEQAEIIDDLVSIIIQTVPTNVNALFYGQPGEA